MSEGPRCIHCKRRKGQTKLRWLCCQCWRDKAIRLLYPKRNHQPTTTLDPSKLEPAPSWPDRCVHGLKDGTCVPCERAQRNAMVFEESELEEVEAA